MRSKSLLIVISVVAALAAVAVIVSAGDPDNPPGPPDTTASYTLETIYDRLETGATGTPITFTEPISGPTVGTGHTLDEIMAVAPQADNAHGATAAQVVSGTKYWSLRSGAWGQKTGTMPNRGAVTIVPTTTHVTIAMGYHDGDGYVLGDADLVAAHIVSGTSIFGVAGTYVGSGGITYEAGVPRTGQTISYTAGDDGDLQVGVDWMTRTRFVTGTTGTTGVTVVVTDTLTGLVWLQDANCAYEQYRIGTVGRLTWLSALDFVIGITVTGPYSKCAAGFNDWRLPNVRELQSLIDYGERNPALPAGHPFASVWSNSTNQYGYWSSTTVADGTNSAWYVDWVYGDVNTTDAKNDARFVWPVRGGQ